MLRKWQEWLTNEKNELRYYAALIDEETREFIKNQSMMMMKTSRGLLSFPSVRLICICGYVYVVEVRTNDHPAAQFVKARGECRNSNYELL